MKMNPEKCHVFILRKEIIPENFTIQIGDTQIVPEHEVTLLGVTLDSRLNFNTHINDILKEVSKKVNALVRIAKYLNKSQKALLSNLHIFTAQSLPPWLDVLQQRHQQEN